MNSLQQYKRSHNAPELKATLGRWRYTLIFLHYDMISILPWKAYSKFLKKWGGDGSKQASMYVQFISLIFYRVIELITKNEHIQFFFGSRTCNWTEGTDKPHLKFSMNSINIKASLPVIGDPCLFVCMKSLRN